MGNRTSPPRYHSHQPTDVPRPVSEPRELRNMSDEQRADWVRWLTETLVKANYGVRRPDQRYMFFWKSLANALEEVGVDVPPYTLINYVKKGSQPSIEVATGLARVLDLHPLSVAYRAHLLSEDTLARLIGSGRLRPIAEIQRQIEALANLPESMADFRAAYLDRNYDDLAMMQQLQTDLGLTEDDLGALAARIVKREIHGQQQPIHPPAQPGQIADTLEEQQRRHPGPRARHIPQGDEPEELA